MDEPAKAASRLLYGTGFGLILACGFGLIQGRMEIGQIGFGHIFLLISLICLAAGRLLKQNQNYLKMKFCVLHIIRRINLRPFYFNYLEEVG